MRVVTLVLSIMLVVGSAVSGAGATTQEASPVPGQELDLPAIALAPDDVPEGFFDEYSEWLLTPAAFSGFVLNGEPVSSNLAWVYQSFYFNNDEQAAIHNYLFAYTDSEAAAADLGVVDAMFLRPPLPDGTVTGPTITPGMEMGEGESTMTQVSYDTQAEGGPLVDVVALTFHRDHLVAGVSIERFHEPSEDGTPVVGTTEPGEADIALAEDLARVLDGRITTVISGEVPQDVNPALSDTMLPIAVLANPDTPLFSGYRSGIDLLRCGVCGEENSLAPFADDALGGFSRGLSAGPLVDGEPMPPWVLVTIVEFSSPEAALNVLETMREAPNDRPTAAPIPRGERTLVDDPVIPGVTPVLGLQGISDPENPDATVDSASVSFVHESLLVSIDVLGGLPAEDAMDVAVNLATQQNECLTVEGLCQDLTIPDPLT